MREKKSVKPCVYYSELIKNKLIYGIVYLTCRCVRLGADRISRLLNKHSNRGNRSRIRLLSVDIMMILKCQKHLTVRLLIVD